MSKVVPLIVFGVGLTVCGIFWSLWDGSRSYMGSFVIDNSYYQLMGFVFDIIPAILLIVGIICLVAAGVTSKGSFDEGV